MKTGRDITGLGFTSVVLKGRPYVRAYRNKWVPGENGKRGRSHTAEAHHVGALQEDGTVKISKAFQARFPELAGKRWVYRDRDLVEVDIASTEADCVLDSEPDSTLDSAPEVACDTVEDVYPRSRQFLGSWAIRASLQKNGTLETLAQLGGECLANQMVELAVYGLLSGDTCAEAFPEWLEGNFVDPDAESLTEQRISEIFRFFDRDRFEEFWRLRFERSQLQGAEGESSGVRYFAFESKSTFTYSPTILDASFGQAKEDPELRQITLVTVMDRITGEIVYALPYEGAVNDVSTTDHVLSRMERLGFPMNEIAVVSERGCDSPSNLSADTHFLIGDPLVAGGTVERFMLSDKGALLDSVECWDPETQTGTATLTEPGEDGHGVTQTLYTHIYKDPRLATEQFSALKTRVVKALGSLNAEERLSENEMKDLRPYLVDTTDEKTTSQTKPKGKWGLNDQALDRGMKLAGAFALRTDCISDAPTALALYRERRIIEDGFDCLKNAGHGERLCSTDSTYYGKLLMHLLGQSVAMQVRRNVRCAKKSGRGAVELPGNSVPRMLKALSNIRITKRQRNQHWRVDAMPKKVRDWLQYLFEVPLPPKHFK